MTDPDTDVDEPAMTNEEAAEVVENDPALQEAGADSPPPDPSDAS